MSNKIRKFTIKNNDSRKKGKGWAGRFFGVLKKIKSKLPGGDRKKGKTRLRKIISFLPYAAIAAILAAIVGGLVIFAWVRQDLPDPNKLANRSVAQTTKIYDRNGETVLYEVHGEEKRTVVELEDMSPHIINATIVAEDRDFYEHKGYKITGYARAFIENMKSGHRSQGGSTITQQLVKNALLSPEKTYTRKLKELLLSIEIERNFSKDEILKMYLNEIPYGSVNYGIESAAESFFDKTAEELTLSEAALLASLPQSTTYLSPYGSHTDELLERQKWILDSMFELGYITFDKAEDAKQDDVLARIKPRSENLIAPHFVFYVREQLADELGEQLVERGGLKIITTLDTKKQELAERAISDNYENLTEMGASNAALLSLDPENGDILAMIGSADYFNDEISGKYNSLLGLRQPGSSIKPLIYSTGFEQGYTPDTVLFDVVTKFGNSANPYVPQNHDFSERGPVTVREALAGSLNIPAVKMLYLAGIDNVIKQAEEMGYTTLSDRDRFGLSLALGGGEVKPIEHISSFSAYANDGLLAPDRAILRVEDRNGKVLLEHAENQENAKKVLSKQSARQTTSILSDNAARAYVFGENSYLQLGERPVAAKTGTTNSYKDAWTIGYTPSLVAGVWVGNSNGSKMNPGAGGSRVAAPIWNKYMREALKDMDWESFPAPKPEETGKPVLDGDKESQVMLEIDSVTGLLATEHTPKDLIVEKGFGIPHSILYFVDRTNPQGPKPENPSQDPMFESWESAIADWVKRQEKEDGLELETEPPPTEEDNVHVPENKPNITIRSPKNGETIDSREIAFLLDADAKRGITELEFSINGAVFDTYEGSPSSRVVADIPNKFSKGYHTIEITAYDDVKNRSSAEVTINLTAEPGPIGVDWLSPKNLQTIYRSQFPYTVRFRVADYKIIETLKISVRPASSKQDEEIIGSMHNPPLSNMSIKWSEAPRPGRYRLRLTAELPEGGEREEEILVTVR